MGRNSQQSVWKLTKECDSNACCGEVLLAKSNTYLHALAEKIEALWLRCQGKIKKWDLKTVNELPLRMKNVSWERFTMRSYFQFLAA